MLDPDLGHWYFTVAMDSDPTYVTYEKLNPDYAAVKPRSSSGSGLRVADCLAILALVVACAAAVSHHGQTEREQTERELTLIANPNPNL